MCHHTRTNLGGVVVNSSNSNILDALWEITLAWARVRLAEVTIKRSKSIWGVYSREDYCTSQCKPPHPPPDQDIAGHLQGIFRLTSERAAGIGEFDLFSMSSKNSRGMDRGIFHRGGLGQESLARQDGGFWPWKEVKSRFILITLSLAEYAIRPLRSLYNAKNTYIYNWLFCEQKSFVTVFARCCNFCNS